MHYNGTCAWAVVPLLLGCVYLVLSTANFFCTWCSPNRCITHVSEWNPSWFQPSAKRRPSREQVVPDERAQESVSAFTLRKLTRLKCRYEAKHSGTVKTFYDVLDSLILQG